MKRKRPKEFFRNWLQIIVIMGSFVFLVIYLNDVIYGIRRIISVLNPVIIGAFLALILNLLLVKVERIYFPKSKKELIQKSRRAVSLLISVLIVLAVIALILGLVIPQLIKAINIVSEGLPRVYEGFVSWAESNQSLPAFLRDRILESDFDMNKLVEKMMTGLQDWIGSIATLLGRIVSSIVDMIFSIILAIYLLANKEALLTQSKELAFTYLPRKVNISLSHVLIVAYDSFVSYFGGQILDALILGILTGLGMVILGLPFAPVVASVAGISALIPVFGAYISNFVGVLLILTVSPVKALIFFVFMILLQQVDNSLIYPRIVGTRVGLPSYLVLIAIILGAGFGGIFGILIAVPIMATIYRLIKEDTEFRNKDKTQSEMDLILAQANKTRLQRESPMADLGSPDEALANESSDSSPED